MALITCGECGAEISPRAVMCPRCGDIPWTNLARFLFKLLLAAIPVWFVVFAVHAIVAAINEPK